MKCKQELCPNWSGDGNVCPCALFDLDTDATDPLPWDDPNSDPLQDVRDFIRNEGWPAPYPPPTHVQYGPSQLPHNPANRRTFHLAGKPYHYVQTEDGLQTRPGESPWR